MVTHEPFEDGSSSSRASRRLGGLVRHSREHLLPSTFEARGAAVPFTTPALACARVRLSWRDALELSVANFAESGGTYVVPFKALREVMTLTAHDVVLHETILERRALDPEAVRLAALEAARTGLAGVDAVARAEQLIAEAEDSVAVQQVLIILQGIREVGTNDANALLLTINTEDGRQRIRATLGEIAKRVNLSADVFEARVATLASGTASVGLSWSPEPSRMRQLLEQLKQFETGTRVWAALRGGESAEAARLAADVAAHTLAIAENARIEFDRTMARTLDLMKAWEKSAGAALRAARRVIWLLDGWGTLLESWFRAVETGTEIEALAHLMPILPLIPRNELDEVTAAATETRLSIQTRRWVRMNTDWRTGELDYELVERIEAMKGGPQ